MTNFFLLNILASFVRALEIILNNILENQNVKKREFYYLDPKLFKSQDYVDQILKEISMTVQVPRNSLNVVE